VTTKAGFVALGGRPNVGKSTLVNAIVGSKVAIVSDKPQTTRRAIRGIVMRGDAQLVLVDLPGVQRPRDALTQRMQHRVEHELADADAAVLMLNGEQGVGPGDRFIANALAGTDVPVTIVVNKLDRLNRAATLAALQAAAELELEGEVFAVSARKGTGVEALVEHLLGLLPENLVRVQALVWVETESQKGILIGAQGRMIKAIGTAARRELERHFDLKVHLELSVRVRRGWRGDDALLDRLGIE